MEPYLRRLECFAPGGLPAQGNKLWRSLVVLLLQRPMELNLG